MGKQRHQVEQLFGRTLPAEKFELYDLVQNQTIHIILPRLHQIYSLNSHEFKAIVLK